MRRDNGRIVLNRRIRSNLLANLADASPLETNRVFNRWITTSAESQQLAPVTSAHRQASPKSLASRVAWCTHVCTQKSRIYELLQGNRPFAQCSADCQTAAVCWANSYPSSDLAMTIRWIWLVPS